MRHKSFKTNLCPVARSLDTIGEWWSLLIVRDALCGIRRFSDFQKSVGLAKNILSARLKKLVACGIMEHVPASDGSAYQEYALTQKGRELLPVIVALRQWGESYLFSHGEKRFQVLDKRTRNPRADWKCTTRKGKSLRPTIWNWLLLRIERTFTASNPPLSPERNRPRAEVSGSEQVFELDTL